MAKHVFTGVFIPANIWLSKELSPAEKMILGEVDALSKETGWCYAGRKHFTEWLHCTPQNVTYYVNNLERLGYLKVERSAGERSRMQIVNERFYLVGSKEGLLVSGSQSSLPGSQSSLRAGSQSSLPGSQSSLPASYIQDKNKNKIQDKNNAGASDPLSPPFKKVDEIYPEQFSLKEEKADPLHRGPGAVRVSITDPEFPGVTVVDAVGPKTKPTKTGREKPQRNAPNIHPENETVFQHFSDPAKARAAWAEWLQYKYDQHRERYKNAKSELVKLRSLWEETKGDAAQVERNISHSIGNLYRGIFAPKAEKNGTQQPNGLNKATAQHLDLAQYVGQRRIAAMERAMQNGTLASAPEERQF